MKTHEGVFVVTSIIDLTERRRAAERFRLVVEALPGGIVAADAEGRITLVNSQTEKLFGYQRDELIGQTVEMLVPDRFHHHHQNFREGFMADPRARGMGLGRDLFGVRKDGTEVPIEIGLNPVSTPDGILVLVSIIDISERKQAERAIAQQREELERSNRDLEQFAYVASHDLQEPLRAVAGCVQLLQKRYQGQIDARADEFIGHAVEGCKRMQSLINDLLTLSRIGRIEDQCHPVSTTSALATALRNLSAAIQESGAQISWDPLPAITGDESQMVMLFQNLLGNAIKFRKPGEVSQIHVGVVRNETLATFSIQDNGIGIAPEHFERIFGVFQRLHTRNEYPGTGIGLAVCKRIVERHSGRIWIESAPGAGTVFHFVLPLSNEES